MSEPFLQINPFVGAARITSRPYCAICRVAGLVGPEHAHCRGGSITSRHYKKIIPLLQTFFCSSDLKIKILDLWHQKIWVAIRATIVEAFLFKLMFQLNAYSSYTAVPCKEKKLWIWLDKHID